MRHFHFAILAVTLFSVGTSVVFADEILDPEAVFDTNAVQAATANAPSVEVGYDNQKSVSFSGQLNATGGLLLNRDWMSGKTSVDSNKTLQYTEGDFFLDLRYPNGLKAFLDVALLHSSSAVSTANPYDTTLTVKELFVDYHVDRKVYVRSGKQFVTWGRSYFWNPVDFVNRNKKNFLDLSAIRSGIVGTRIDIPLGTDQNLYFFLDQDGVSTPKNFALVSKADLTWEDVAIGLSIWTKYHAVTQYGLDWSTRLWDWNVSQEVALSQGSNTPRMIETNGDLAIGSAPNTWQARTTLSLMRQFNWERTNRISNTLEIFYNGDGYTANVLENADKSAFLQANRLITANQLSTWYAAYFVIISEFPTHDQSLAVNGIINGIDGSSVISTQLTHNFSSDFSISALVAMINGSKTTEYGLSGDGLRVQAQTQLKF